jgi:anti-sigma B factor antagonist
MQLDCPPKMGDRPRDLMVVHFTGSKLSLDEETLDQIRDSLLDLADEPIAADVLLDFGNVDYVSSALLDTLVRLFKKLRTADRRMSVANLGPLVYEVFTVTRLNTLFNLHRAGPDDALPAYGAANGISPLTPRGRQDRWLEVPRKGA